jgi:hypothetical protein
MDCCVSVSSRPKDLWALPCFLTGNLHLICRSWSWPFISNYKRGLERGELTSRRENSVLPFLTLAPDGNGLSALRSGTQCIGGWVGPRASPHVTDQRKIFRFCLESNPNSSALHPVAQSLSQLSFPKQFQLFLFSMICYSRCVWLSSWNLFFERTIEWT